MDERRIRAELDACLIAADEFTPEAWSNLPDPFASWNRSAI
jgi:hypothetical protein